MDIDIYFEPVSQEILQHISVSPHAPNLGGVIDIYAEKNKFPDMSDTDIAIIGVGEDRNAVNNKGCADAPDPVREELYKLYPEFQHMKIADLGNIKPGLQVEDTYSAVTMIVSELIKAGIIPVIIGGSQDLTYANYLAYEKLGQIINVVQIDAEFDLGTIESELTATTYLSKIITYQPNFLFILPILDIKHIL